MQMRTTLNISGELLAEIARLSGVNCKTEIIDRALRELLDRLRRQRLKEAWGKITVDPGTRGPGKREST